MKLSEKQSDFLWMVYELLTYTRKILGDKDVGDGLYIKVTEWNRTKETQKEYVKKGVSSTMNSKHLVGLAVDFAVMKDGQFLKKSALYLLMGIYWEKIGGTWGGRWNVPKDPYHFEYNETKREKYLESQRRPGSNQDGLSE